jgi:hypothetical protein
MVILGELQPPKTGKAEPGVQRGLPMQLQIWGKSGWKNGGSGPFCGKSQRTAEITFAHEANH